MIKANFQPLAIICLAGQCAGGNEMLKGVNCSSKFAFERNAGEGKERKARMT